VGDGDPLARVGCTSMQDSVTVHIGAPVGEVWNLVTDITRIGEFSPETFEAEWLDDASGPEVGARFRGHVKRNEKGPVYWSTCEVTACEPQRSFEFTVLIGSRPTNNWRYDLEPAGEGTAVTESFRLENTLPNKLYWAAAGRWRGRTNRAGMQATLERMKDALESAAR
jgi:uncharacterized protein YndB with AHSA1/START domain